MFLEEHFWRNTTTLTTHNHARTCHSTVTPYYIYSTTTVLYYIQYAMTPKATLPKDTTVQYSSRESRIESLKSNRKAARGYIIDHTS